MEELLNKLIKIGWHPFGWDDKLSSLHKEYGVGKWYIRFHNGMDSELFDLRQLTSKESGLWQFVCENGLLNVDKKYEWEYWTQSYKRNGVEYTHEFSRWCENYRLIETALVDEDQLEQFLLDKIKIS